ncbi:MAG TPA: diaminopimelate epimerase [Verrucomicrobia bacterium]|nr:diaminopimelate epimerase [Verrucomicrobiota bacterium]
MWQAIRVKVDYTKMHGAGNDFVVIDDRSKTFAVEDMAGIQAMCNRETGIGSDGLILLQSSGCAAFRMRFFNPDGTEVSMCGNGARCIARFAADLGLVESRFEIETAAGVLEAHLDGDRVCLRLGRWQEATLDVWIMDKYHLDMIDTGVRHTVMWLHDLDELMVMDLDAFGALIRHHSFFSPEGTNVSVAAVDEQGEVHLRTYERGVEGETLACGTGALAAARLAVVRGFCSFPVEVRCRSEEKLMVDDAEGCMVLSGRAVKMEEGVWSGGDRF